MLTAEGFGRSQAPFAGELVDYVVLRGAVIDGPKRAGSVVKLNPKSGSAIELTAMGVIKRLPDAVEVPVQETNRAVGIDNGIAPPQKRGKKNGRN